MSEKRPTIYDVARVAGVSRSLVSLVLRGSDKVSDASREAVETAIAELGYRPSRAASELASGRTETIAVLIDDYANTWFVDLLRGLEGELARDGYRVSVVDTAGATDTEALRRSVDALLSLRADAIVVARDLPPSLTGRTLTTAVAPPLVVAGTRLDMPEGVDGVANDDAAGARLVAEHLLALGHRRIGHLAVAGGAGAARRASFVAAVAAGGGEVIVVEHDGAATEAEGRAAALGLLRAHPELTAVFGANDLMAIGVLGAARELGIRVPEQLSVAGYDSTEIAASGVIDLTTVDDRSYDMGVEVGRMVRDLVGGRPAAGERRVLEPTLIPRGTTGPARRL
ncbi:LacI family DNA-binding transcriptional regulator [Schumannella luteola]|uniref:DNA-binding LacI/PurR family transcriptional regulator n=1 Tax=Schumannella luteola TaxID=472059 RepID=A0A852YHY8_9MICO|nr:LacI family DNA-binding transcriptional regulator [Schumannella luteola]NYH00752.1 DNA-binding LacI/PurR family transcriptional regulator [Schumannella luteola]TPX03963.1 LacI family transcriptional regulator [Schumannella luteola]